MDSYFSSTVDRLNKKNFIIFNLVLGNESCDLDSAVSSLVFAVFLKWQHDKIKCKVCTRDKRDESNYTDDLFLSILDIDRKDYNLKTEVAYCFKKHGISDDKLVFRDDLDLKEVVSSHQSNVILVDHHVLSKNHQWLAPYVTEVMDHRPLDKSAWKYKDDTRCNIETVGSCATLVAQRVRLLAALVAKETDFFNEFPVCADLLHSAIILDTVNFSKEVGKGTPLDEEMVVFLEGFTKPANSEDERIKKLQLLSEARMDVSSLTNEQLLKKDVKQISYILVPGLPILVEEFLKKPDALSSVKSALTTNSCRIALVLGMNLKGRLERDAAIYSEDKSLGDQLSKYLQSWSTPSLQLSPIELPNSREFTYFRQNNLSASRKQYVQALNTFLNK